MKLTRLVVAYPGGNTTALIFGRRPRIGRKELNQRIMDAWRQKYPDSPQIEQCGFVSGSPGSIIGNLEMLGGEFCANATRSAAWVLQNGENGSGSIKTSGSSRPLSFNIDNRVVFLEMPAADVETVKQGTLVQFAGITQLVVPDNRLAAGGEEGLLRDLLKSGVYGLRECAAVGVSTINKKTNTARFAVWVKAVDTVFNETACGSGTCAIGISEAAGIDAEISLKVIQPSKSSITVTARPPAYARASSATIAGAVDIIYDGEFRL